MLLQVAAPALLGLGCADQIGSHLQPESAAAPLHSGKQFTRFALLLATIHSAPGSHPLTTVVLFQDSPKEMEPTHPLQTDPKQRHD